MLLTHKHTQTHSDFLRFFLWFLSDPFRHSLHIHGLLTHHSTTSSGFLSSFPTITWGIIYWYSYLSSICYCSHYCLNITACINLGVFCFVFVPTTIGGQHIVAWCIVCQTRHCVNSWQKLISKVGAAYNASKAPKYLRHTVVYNWNSTAHLLTLDHCASVYQFVTHFSLTRNQWFF